MAGHSWSVRRRVAVVVGLVTVLGAAAGCAGATSGGFQAVAPQSPAPTTAAGASVSALAVNVAAGAVFAPAAPVSVTLSGGSLTSVTLTEVGGASIAGEFGPDHSAWNSTGQLRYNRSYSLQIVGEGRDGQHYAQSRSFATVRPGNLTMPTLIANEGMLLDGGTFGTGQPITVRFDEHITDRAAAERALTVTTSPPGVEGGWYWMSANEVHWRPRFHWPPNTQVTVTAAVYGHDLGGGLYGEANRTATFTIGRDRIAVADANTHRMKVFVDGALVTNINGHDVTGGIPISMGKGGTEREPNGTVVDFTTNSGPHVITLKYEVIRMSSASFGITDPHSPNYYDVQIRKAIRITGDGEFVHLRDWDVYQIGNVNTSHGCINVGADYIYWFYDNFGAGDIVDVVGTNRQLDVRNGLGDWVLSWEDWQKGSALHA